MISISEQTSTTRYVYFDDSGTITCITGREQENTNDSFAFFEIDDILGFLEGMLKFSDYAVTRTDNPIIFEIVKKRADVRHRNVSNQISKVTDVIKEGDVIITINEDSIDISGSEDLVRKSKIRENQVVSLGGSNEHPFFITHKDRPDFIISTLLVDFSDILSGKKTSIKYEHKYEVSIYTKKYFDTYSLRRTY